MFHKSRLLKIRQTYRFMGANNNFKKLMEEDEAIFIPPPIIEEKLEKSISSLDFFGRIIELFVPRIVELMIAMLGGTLEQLKEVEPTFLLTEEGESDRDDDLNPGDANTDTTK